MILAGLYAIQTPAIQTKLSTRVLKIVEQQLNAKIRYSRLHIDPSGALILNDATLIDPHPTIENADTILYARRISATFTLLGLIKDGGVHLGKVRVEDGLLHIVPEPTKYNVNFSRAINQAPPGTPDFPILEPNEVFSIRHASIKNFRFKLHNYKGAKPRNGKGVDYTNMDLISDIQAHNISFKQGRMYGSLESLELREKSGYTLSKLSAECAAGMGEVMVKDISIIDPWTNLHLDHFAMLYDTNNAFVDYIGKVRMTASIDKGQVGAMTLFYLAGMGDGSDCKLDFKSCNYDGTVADFRVWDLHCKELTSGIEAQNISCHISGIPAIDQMQIIDSRIENLSFDTHSLSILTQSLGIQNISNSLSKIASGIPFQLYATASGKPNKLQVQTSLKSSEGSLSVAARVLNLLEKSADIEIESKIESHELNIGRLLNISDIGGCSLYAQGRAMIGKEPEFVSLDSLHIQELHYKHNDYQNIQADGRYRNGRAILNAMCTDPKLDFTLSALADLKKQDEKSSYRIDGNFRNIDLYALQLDKRSEHSCISAEVNAEVVEQNQLYNGYAQLSNLRLENPDGNRIFDVFDIEAKVEKNHQSVSLNSPVFDARLIGEGTISQFINKLRNNSLRRELTILFDGPKLEESTIGDYNLDILCHDSRELLSFLLPKLYVADSTSIKLHLDSNSLLTGSLNSPLIAYGENYIRQSNISLDNFGHALKLHLQGEEINAGNFSITHPSIEANANDDSIAIKLGFESILDYIKNGELNIASNIIRDSSHNIGVQAKVYQSLLHTPNSEWTINESELIYHDKTVNIDEFKLSNGKQSISAVGEISRSPEDSLSVQIQDFDLGLIQHLVKQQMELEGKLNGRAVLSFNPNSIEKLNCSLRLDSLLLSKIDAGKILINAHMAQDENSVETMKLNLQQTIQNRNTIFASGSFVPKSKDTDIDLRFNSLPLGLASSFLTETLSRLEGSLSGGIKLQGSLEQPKLSSNGLYISNALAQVAYTSVLYKINGPLRLDTEGLHFDSLKISDSDSGTASLDGMLGFGNFKNFGLNSELKFTNLLCLDQTKAVPNGVYGQLRANGTIKLSGPLNALQIDGDIATSGAGNIHIPASGQHIASTSSDLLRFTEKVKPLDPYDAMMHSYSNNFKPKGELSINAKVSTSSAVKAFVEIDKSSGNVVSFSGNGAVSLNLKPSKKIMELNGDYILSEGSYNFVLPGVLTRSFSVQNGSSVKFGGELGQTQLDVNATYSLKASLSTLVADVSTQRQVDCGIKISERLSNPKIDFSIDVPNLDPSTKTQIESALSTPDKIQKQFLALLLMGAFIPDESSGVINGSNLLLSNATELMSSQLNTILQKLEIPFDVGIGYQSMAGGNNIFDLAISTQLFNNRVIVGGSVGNRNFKGLPGSSGDVVGNLDIQIKIDQEGRYRLNIFSHSVDQYSSFIDFSQRNGIGISFQRGFNAYDQPFKLLFLPKSKHSEFAPKSERKQVSIDIDND